MVAKSNGNGHRNGDLCHRSLTCFACPAKQDSEWGTLSPVDLRFLDTVKVCNEYSSRQTLFHAGNPCLGLHCVVRGAVVERQNSPSGQSLAIRLAAAGDLLGCGALFARRAYATTAETLTDSAVCFIPNQAVADLLERNSEISRSFLARLARSLRRSEEARLAASSMPVRARLASLLLALRERFGVAHDDGRVVMELPVSRRDIASMVGARPETLARLVRAFGEEGVATFSRKTVSIPSLDRLLEEAGDAPEI